MCFGLHIRTVKMNILFGILLMVCAANSAKILGIFTIPIRSHYQVYSVLMKELAERGHNVTVISPFEDKNSLPNGNYREFVYKGVTEWMKTIEDQYDVLDTRYDYPFIYLLAVPYLMSQFGEKIWADENVQKLINSGEKFDLVILEFGLDVHKALAAHLGASVVLFNIVGSNSWISKFLGNPAPPSYIPNHFVTYSSKMTFLERVSNVIFTFLVELDYHFCMVPIQNSLIRKYLPNSPNVEDVAYNISLALLISHPSITQPVPTVPNMIEVGGFHIKPPKKLPQDLQEYLDNATDGAIYFSMGSNVKSSKLPKEKRDAFLKTFSKLKQKVLWKWEEDVLPGQPHNVKLSKWLPQRDILAHPNIKLFITHGGLISTIETIYHGVPVLVIPIYFDQKINARMAVENSYGLSLSYDDITEEHLTGKIEEILNDPKYKEEAKRRSQIFHDRPVKPLDSAVYWVEYVIRHKGAPHLRVAGLDLLWYQYHLLDVIVFIIICFLITTMVAHKIFKMIYNKICSKSGKIKTS